MFGDYFTDIYGEHVSKHGPLMPVVMGIAPVNCKSLFLQPEYNVGVLKGSKLIACL